VFFVGGGANFDQFPAGEGGFSVLRSYVQGNDFIGSPNGTSPGQPRSAVNLRPTNTTCAGNVATTVVPAETLPASITNGIVALQGKPLVPTPAGEIYGDEEPYWTYDTMYVRVPTPTFEWVVGVGGETPLAEQRRPVADTEQCLKCHVGSLYQHGNTRVDNVTLCVMCHNPASSEQNIRVGMGVDASEAYDGLVGQTYELKTLLHMVHTAGVEGQKPVVIYRNRGIYAWAPDVSLLPNWATGAACDAPESVVPGPDLAGNIVFGSDPASTNKCQVHNFYSPTYPRAFNDCGACHVADFNQVPDQAKAVATTLDAGAAPWANQLDDVLQGAGAAACTTCHQGGATKGHAIQNGWEPRTFPNGRQTIIDAAN
jgi:hypothetical protein